ncbi:integrin beta 3 [Allocatelliglobosispora scoriae]|uniref:Integrin beta 3 n=1 Tax=Allocatelliglobosispora scoriae TaxID=643052 RepID=A0A841C2C2_9ACTN|nr:hypothetical protein [Allocatelliglobosispora scoriae]MBB5873120.1 integrin beta 3 [Allocatelliglobosispora scoriae]
MARDTDGGGRDGRGRRGDQPADEGRGRRRGRNEPEEVPGEELGWLDDLRSAKEAKGDLGPGGADAAPPPARRPRADDDAPREPRDAGTRGGAGDSRWADLRGEPASGAAPGAREPAPRDAAPRDAASRDSAPRDAAPRESALREGGRGRRHVDEPISGAPHPQDAPPPRRTPDEPLVGGRRSTEPTGGTRRAPDEPLGGARRAPDEPIGGPRRGSDELLSGGRRGLDEPSARGRRGDDRRADDRRGDLDPPRGGRRGAVPEGRKPDPLTDPLEKPLRGPGRRAASADPVSRVEPPRAAEPRGTEPPPRSGGGPARHGGPEPEDPLRADGALRRASGRFVPLGPRRPTRPVGPAVPESGNARPIDPGPPSAGGRPGESRRDRDPRRDAELRRDADPRRDPELRRDVDPRRDADPRAADPRVGDPRRDPQRPPRDARRPAQDPRTEQAIPFSGAPGAPPMGPPPKGAPLGPPMGPPVGPPPMGAPVLGPPVMGPPVLGPPVGAPMSAPLGAPVGPPQRIPVDGPPLRPADGTDGSRPDAGPRGSRAGLAAGVDMVQGARSELRKQMREHQRLRMWTMIAVVVTLLGAIPLYLMIQSATRDPVFTSLDALSVPGWAAEAPVDQGDGSRWCIIECRYRERAVHSTKAFAETSKAYESALIGAGWRKWTPEACPEQPVPGVYSCWRRDEFTLDLWVRPPACADNLLYNRPTVGPTASEAPADGMTPNPSPSAECTGSDVLIKVTNAIEDGRKEGHVEPVNPDLDLEIDPSLLPSAPASP